MFAFDTSKADENSGDEGFERRKGVGVVEVGLALFF